MTDLEMTRLCAEAMGYKPAPHTNRKYSPDLMWVANGGNYNPLTDDAQAMALVKKMQLFIMPECEGMAWSVSNKEDHIESEVLGDDLNRAIVECVAKMQEAKNG